MALSYHDVGRDAIVSDSGYSLPTRALGGSLRRVASLFAQLTLAQLDQLDQDLRMDEHDGLRCLKW
jgi:hypothetical protein